MGKVIVGVLVVVLVAVGAWFLLNKNTQTKSAQSTTLVTATQAPSKTATASPSASPSAQAAETTVSVSDTGFNPQSITIKAGTKVTWQNKSGSLIAVDSDPHPIHTSYPPLNLGDIANGESKSLVFNTAGTYHYHNHLNPSQTGVVVVE